MTQAADLGCLDAIQGQLLETGQNDSIIFFKCLNGPSQHANIACVHACMSIKVWHAFLFKPLANSEQCEI